LGAQRRCYAELDLYGLVMEIARKWPGGTVPIAVVMISLNEGHNLEGALASLSGWAQEVFLVDSCSVDDTVDVALRYGVHVVQRNFRGFGDQWNFALRSLPITAPWTMKVDPDERLTDELKREIEITLASTQLDAYRVRIRLYFMGARLPSVLRLVRLWRTGSARFSDVLANEHALVSGPQGELRAEIMHLDSPDLDHWVTKQNRYTTAEAVSQAAGASLTVKPRLLGEPLERRMWLKKNFWNVPGRYVLLFLYHLLVLGAWRSGRVGLIWARLRTEVYRLWEYKRFEICLTGRKPLKVPGFAGSPDPRVPFYE
jgi:glycosyltransferase involved in cell wall biosynthesis